jgi:tetratricopeptide (TPR) repeat protein
MLAVFGLDAPDDAVSRAAHAALAIAKAAERGRRAEATATRAQYALHAASVLVGIGGGTAELGMDDRREVWSVLDELIGRAPLDGIAVSPSAAPLLRRRFELAVGSGAGGPTHVLVGHERTGLGLGGHTGEFVGRRDELELLESRLATALRGQGQVVGIAGEAGIGKSRLAFEFRQRLAARDIAYLEAHCHGYVSAVAYLPVIELVRGICGITEADTPEANREKVETALQRVGLDAAAQSPYLLHLLGMKDGTDALGDEAPEAMKSRLLEVLRQLVLRLSRTCPLVIVLDDLQWIDKASEEYVGSLAEVLNASPILLIATYRPGYQQPWIRKSYATQIALQPLDAAQARRVVDAVLGDRPLPPALLDAIVTKAEGNAFFLEEMARAARDAADPGTTVAVPETVQDVLLARMERLWPAERSLLMSAAVVGKRFARSVVEAVAGLPVDVVRPGLAELEAAEFIHETGGALEDEYTFKHALTHEVAYGSLTAPERRRLHRLILASLEAAHGERLNEHLATLAHHAAAGEVWDKAQAYLRQAGAKAYAGGAYREAVACFEEALRAVGELPAGRERDERSVDLQFDLRTSLLPLGEHGAIHRHMRQAHATAAALGDRHRLGRACAYLTNYFFLNGEQDRALEHGRRALDIAGEVGDGRLQAEAHLRLGQVHHALGDFDAAVQVLGGPVRALTGDALYERFGLPLLFSVGCRNWLIRSLVELGRFDEGGRLADEALAIAETARDPFSLTVACWSAGHVHLRRGDIAAAIGPLERGLDLGRQGAIRVWLPRLASALGLALALSGQMDRALSLLAQALDEAARGSAADRSMALLSLGEGHLQAGHVEPAGALADRALEQAVRQRDRGTEAWAHRLQGRVAARGGPAEAGRAEAAFGRSLERAQALGMRPLAAHVRFGLARLLARAGRSAEADDLLASARALYAELGMALWLDRAMRHARPSPDG